MLPKIVSGGNVAFHRIKKLIFVAALAQASSSCLAPSEASENFRNLSEAFSQAVGFYSDGSLLNPGSVIAGGSTQNILKLFPARKTPWATSDLVSIIQTAADEMQERFPGSERLQLGDLSDHDG